MKTGKQKINETKSWLLEKINKIDHSLARLAKKKRRHNLLISEINEESSLLVTRTIKGYYKWTGPLV